MPMAAGLRVRLADDGVISSWERTFSCSIYRRVQERVCVEGACAERCDFIDVANEASRREPGMDWVARFVSLKYCRRQGEHDGSWPDC